jgi:hypothetical protein
MKAKTLFPIIKERVLLPSTVYTDEDPVCGWKKMHEHGYVHRRVQHQQNVYVMGDAHTNTIEGFWSLVEGGIEAFTTPSVGSTCSLTLTNFRSGTTIGSTVSRCSCPCWSRLPIRRIDGLAKKAMRARTGELLRWQPRDFSGAL